MLLLSSLKFLESVKEEKCSVFECKHSKPVSGFVFLKSGLLVCSCGYIVKEAVWPLTERENGVGPALILVG